MHREQRENTFSFQLEPLKSLLADFYAVTHRQIGLFDAEGGVVLRYPETMPLFCHLIMSSPRGKEKCAECDKEGCRLAQEKSALVSYPCHAGLREVCAPIRLEGETVGYLMFGHLMGEESREGSWKEVAEKAADFFEDKKMLRSAFEQLDAEPMDYIRSLSNILESCVCYIQLRHLIQSQGIRRWPRIAEYVETHLKEELTLPGMAETFSMSESTLNRECTENTGMTMGRYIRSLRLKKACQLLLDTDMPVARVADECGMSNYSYFSRWFRMEMGMTPGCFRKEKDNK